MGEGAVRCRCLSLSLCRSRCFSCAGVAWRPGPRTLPPKGVPGTRGDPADPAMFARGDPPPAPTWALPPPPPSGPWPGAAMVAGVVRGPGWAVPARGGPGCLGDTVGFTAVAWSSKPKSARAYAPVVAVTPPVALEKRGRGHARVVNEKTKSCSEGGGDGRKGVGSWSVPTGCPRLALGHVNGKTDSFVIPKSKKCKPATPPGPSARCVWSSHWPAACST